MQSSQLMIKVFLTLYAILLIVGIIQALIKGSNIFKFVNTDGSEDSLMFSEKLKLVIFNPRILGIWLGCTINDILFEHEESEE